LYTMQGAIKVLRFFAFLTESVRALNDPVNLTY